MGSPEQPFRGPEEPAQPEPNTPASSFEPNMLPPRYEPPPAHVRQPEHQPQISFSDALDLYFTSFRLSRGIPRLQLSILEYVHRRYPKVRMSRTVWNELLEKAPLKTYSIVQNPRKHVAQVPWKHVKEEAETRVNDMGAILNGAEMYYQTVDIFTFLKSILDSMIEQDFRYLVIAQTEARFRNNRKLRAILKPVPGVRRSTKMRGLAENPKKYIPAADEDPWASDVCIYIFLLGRPTPYARQEPIAGPLWQMFAELRSVLCTMLSREYEYRKQYPGAPTQYWDKLQQIVNVHNAEPHPKHQVSLEYFVHSCAEYPSYAG